MASAARPSKVRIIGYIDADLFFYSVVKENPSRYLFTIKSITMPKRKADNLSQASFVNSNKKVKQEDVQSTNKPNLLDDSDSDSSSEDGSVGGAKLEEPEFKVNEEYAKRFEHNKKREELQRCQSFILLIIHTY
jgi:hypothetical protein